MSQNPKSPLKKKPNGSPTSTEPAPNENPEEISQASPEKLREVISFLQALLPENAEEEVGALPEGLKPIDEDELPAGVYAQDTDLILEYNIAWHRKGRRPLRIRGAYVLHRALTVADIPEFTDKVNSALATLVQPLHAQAMEIMHDLKDGTDGTAAVPRLPVPPTWSEEGSGGGESPVGRMEDKMAQAG